MEPAKQELEKAIDDAPFRTPTCPIYQNVDAKPYTDPAAIKANLIAQLTAPVRWTYIVKNMLADGVGEFTELGPGTVLQGLIRKVDAQATVDVVTDPSAFRGRRGNRLFFNLFPLLLFIFANNLLNLLRIFAAY